nr:protein longifolia 1-like [Tanacetum cinerariifolium]
MRTVPFTAAKSESSQRRLSGCSDHPNYMTHTQSSRANVRSLSAPGGRRRSKYSNVHQNDDQHREVVGNRRRLVSKEQCLVKWLWCLSFLKKLIKGRVQAQYKRRKGISPLIKCTSAIRQLAYGLNDNFLDEYMQISERSSRMALDHFCEAVMEIYGPEFLRKPTVIDIVKLYRHHEENHGFSGMLASFDLGMVILVRKVQWRMPNDVIPDTLSFAVSSEINRKKLQNIKHLVQKLTSLDSTHDEAHTDYIASLCENTKADDRYIFEILLASGLLLRVLGSSLTTFQFYSSGHPINFELFLVLEQTKFSNFPKQEPSNKRLLNKENFHKKLIFDTVNEVLVKKLALVVPSLETFSSKYLKLANKTLYGQKLLRDLCMEIEELLQVKKKKEDVSLDQEDDGLRTILWEDRL